MARKRNSKGHFVKSGSSSRRRSSRRTTAIVVASPRAITRTRTRTIVRTARRRHSGGGGGGGHTPLKTRLEYAVYGAILGYLETNNADTYAKIPTVGKLPTEIVIGGVLTAFAKKSKHVDRAATAALVIGGNKLAKQGFKISGDFDD